jgi:uncharacterized protein
MSEQDVATLRKAYDDFNAGNIDAVVATLADDVQWTEPGGGNAPSGTFNGPDAVAKSVFGSVPENFDEFVAKGEDFTDEDGTVIVTGRFTGKNKSGAELDATFEHVWEMRDGKVARFEHKPDKEAWAKGWGG